MRRRQVSGVRCQVPGEDPDTREQWQLAADGAEFFLHLVSARQYGLVTGGPKVNTDRCEEVLRLAAARGVRPRPDAVERWARVFAGERSESNVVSP